MQKAQTKQRQDTSFQDHLVSNVGIPYFSRSKEKSHISEGAGMTSDEVQHPFMILKKALSKLKAERTPLTWYREDTSRTIHNSEMVKASL